MSSGFSILGILVLGLALVGLLVVVGVVVGVILWFKANREDRD